MNRELDAQIAEEIHGWKMTRLGKDYHGANACEILTPEGKLYEGFMYPPVGTVHRGYHVPNYSSCFETACGLARFVGLPVLITELPSSPEEITKMCLEHWRGVQAVKAELKQLCERIREALKAITQSPRREVTLHEQMAFLFEHHALSYQREVVVPSGRLDFVVEERVIVEVKINGTAKQAFRQIEQYLRETPYQRAVLVTTKPMNGFSLWNCEVIDLWKQFL